jgi:hypothetical protein
LHRATTDFHHSSCTQFVLDQGRMSAQKQAWGAAFAQLSEADRQTPLDPEDLQLLSMAAHLIKRRPVDSHRPNYPGTVIFVMGNFM